MSTYADGKNGQMKWLIQRLNFNHVMQRWEINQTEIRKNI